MKRTRQTLIGSLRGDGQLRADGRSTSVTYELDRFTDSNGPRASGSVSGDVAAMARGDEEVAAILVLQDGAEISVLVSNAADDGADIEATGLSVEE